MTKARLRRGRATLTDERRSYAAMGQSTQRRRARPAIWPAGSLQTQREGKQ